MPQPKKILFGERCNPLCLIWSPQPVFKIMRRFKIIDLATIANDYYESNLEKNIKLMKAVLVYSVKKKL